MKFPCHFRHSVILMIDTVAGLKHLSFNKALSERRGLLYKGCVSLEPVFYNTKKKKGCGYAL
jgi:hypothetical protein